MTHRDAGRGFARPRSMSTGCCPATGGGGRGAAIAAECRPSAPSSSALFPSASFRSAPGQSAPHVKRAHRAVFARFALSLRIAIRRRAGKEGVPA